MDMPPEIIRMSVFVGLIIGLFALEHFIPRRPALAAGGLKRRATNIAIFLTGAFVGRILVFAAAISAALWAQSTGFGLLNIVQVPLWLAIAITILVMDFCVWAQHVATHLWPPLWRLHRMHHSDTHMDVTTAVRFHPLEIGLSLLFKAGCVLLLGAPAAGVIAFEILLSSFALFNHSNIKLSARLDSALRKVIVTPDMHRIHHSPDPGETNSNYGTFLTVWDYAFGTYIGAAKPRPVKDEVGLEYFRSDRDQTLAALLASPAARPTPPKSNP